MNIRMEDGVLLATDVFIPKGDKKFPTVLVRTPYNKVSEQWLGKAFGLFGIAVVVQDVRGKFKSEGRFYPFKSERADGLSTLRWIRQQSWSNGVVSGWGASYLGYTQWAISDSLDYMALLVTGANMYDFMYPDGVFSLQSAFTWGFENAASETNQVSKEKLTESMLILPLSAADDSTLKDIPYINDWLAHSRYDDYWMAMNHRDISTATMISMAGWYDIFLMTQLNDFQASVSRGDTESRLVIGPWFHGSPGVQNDYGGLRKTGKPQKVFKYVKNQLKGKRNKLTGPLKNSRYNLFIMERNEYVGTDVWPPVESKSTPFYIGPNNYIGPDLPSQSGSLEYTYSPEDPYPSHGGTILGTGVGPSLQNDNILRNDQLIFEMSELENPLILLGPVSANLWVSSDAPCSDFFVEIQDEFPDGRIINIQEGIAHVEFNASQPRETEISIWATGYQINPGHTLRVVIASSWFPRFNRSLNNCESIQNPGMIRDARQKVYYGEKTPSSVSLPLYTFKKK